MIDRKSRAGLGASSILLILVVLCLTAFATLTFVRARLDARLTDRTIAAQQAYYHADAAAQEALALLDDAIAAGKSAPAGWSFTDGAYEQRFPVNDGVVLDVCVSFEAGALRILRYRTQNESQWNTSAVGLAW